MKKIVAFTLLLTVNLVFAQTAKYPYPIIFLHGLSSSDTTWTFTANALGGSAKIYDACLNHDGSNATASLTGSDVDPIGWRDGASAPSPTRLYIMNYDNSRFVESGHSGHTLSNQAAIMKQGVALKAMINAVLSIESTDRVILVGHSMGGLEIREYLQRGFDGTLSGRGTNWVDQTSAAGHRVARVVTTGTPHLGSNMTGSGLSQYVPAIDEKSEACRDLRYPYTIPPSPVTNPAPYLFGATESQFVWSPSPYNLDVNCNGTTGDVIIGLNNGTTYNSAMPLPTNIRYTYITSNLGGAGTDGLVETARQKLYSGSALTPSGSDTILLTINHLQEPRDVQSIVRGLDEPGDTAFAYQLVVGQPVLGFITYNTNVNPADIDVFKCMATINGSLRFKVEGSGSGIDTLIVSTSAGEQGRAIVANDSAAVTISGVTAGNLYYVSVRGTATGTSWQYPYTLSATSLQVTGTKTVYIGAGQQFSTLTGNGGLFDSINTHGLSTNLVAMITSDIAEPGLKTLHRWSGDSTLTIETDGTTVHLLSGNVDSTYGLIRIAGARNVTIDGSFEGTGRYLRFRNTNTEGTTLGLYFGVRSFAMSNCILEGSDDGGYRSIIAINSADSANDGITFTGNLFRDRSDGDYLIAFGLRSTGAEGTGNITFRDNEFMNIPTCIYAYETWGSHWVCTGNSFYGSKQMSLGAIFLDMHSSNNDTMTGNYIGGQGAHCTGSPFQIFSTLTGISVYAPGSKGNLIAGNVLRNIYGPAYAISDFNGFSITSGGTIRGNVVGDPSDSSQGITVGFDANTLRCITGSCDTVEGNTVANLYLTGTAHLGTINTRGDQPTCYGLTFRSSGAVIANNRIALDGFSGEWMDVIGMDIFDTNACSVANNMVSITPSDTTVDIYNCRGIQLGVNGHSSASVFYNTSVLGGKSFGSWERSACFSWTDVDSTTTVVKNNIFDNERTGDGTDLAFLLSDTVNFRSDYNLFHSGKSETFCSFDNQTTLVTLAGWHTASGQDAHSVNTAVDFLDFAHGDLHLSGVSLGDSMLGCLPLAGFPTDIDGDVRNAVKPYMGADENIAHPLHTGKVDVTVHVRARWNLIAAPVSAPPSLRTDLYPGASGPAYAYDPSAGYVVRDTITPGCGYWIKFISATDVSMNGTPLITISIPVVKGWNLIGGLTDTFSVEGVTVAPPEMKLSQFYGYEGSYVSSTILVPGRGYWVRADMAGTITFSQTTSRCAGRIAARMTFEAVPVSEIPPPPGGETTTAKMPVAFNLSQNYPNPFNPSTTIRYGLPEKTHVRLVVCNFLGQILATLVDRDEEAGYKSVEWNAVNMPSGVYFCRLTAGPYSVMKKVMLVK